MHIHIASLAPIATYNVFIHCNFIATHFAYEIFSFSLLLLDVGYCVGRLKYMCVCASNGSLFSSMLCVCVIRTFFSRRIHSFFFHFVRSNQGREIEREKTGRNSFAKHEKKTTTKQKINTYNEPLFGFVYAINSTSYSHLRFFYRFYIYVIQVRENYL